MLKFIDARCQLGRRGVVGVGEPSTHEEILELMERCHIEKAVAYHSIAKEGEMKAGNLELINLTEGDDRFIRQWCAMPSAFGEFMSTEELFAGMKEYNVTSLRLLPKTCGYSLRPYALGKMMAAAAECKVPVFINLEELDAEALYALCKDYPDVNFIVGNTAYRMNRYFGPILESCSNFYVATGNYVSHTGIKTFCEHFGAEKLIFDTGLPTGSATAAVSLISFAEISQEEKQLIASGNIERLLSEVRL